MKNHFEFKKTPLTKLESLSNEYGCNIHMKRDDLFPHGGGGSKARMLQYIIWKAKEEGADYILTAGGPYSNFNRALALLSRKHKLKVRIVLYDNNTHIQRVSLNKKILDYCEIELVPCDPKDVVATLNKEEQSLILNGYQPYFIWGGGKSNEGVDAYIDCYKEIQMDTSENIDYIFTAIGTGTTYSGLLLGSKLITKIIGISVAREKNTATKVVEDIIRKYGCTSYDNSPIEIVDDYLMGGYGYSTPELEAFIRKFIKEEGIVIDAIYVGKALFGMVQYLKKNKPIITGKTIVFLNTGGIYNF